MRTARPARAVRGAASGLVATVPMSVLMAASEALGLLPDPPPPLIVRRLLPALDPRAVDLVTVVTHAAYGAAAGAAFAVLPLRRGPLLGVGFGLAVWAAGYEGWVPLLGVLPPAHRDHRGRVLTMVAAHVVYGVTLGVLTRRSPRSR
jgi:hypothetical protein